MQHGLSSSLQQSVLQRSGPQQYGATHSGPPQFGPHQFGPQLSGPHAPNAMYSNTHGSMNPTQTPACVNDTSRGGFIGQSNPNFQSPTQAFPLAPQPISQHVWQRDTGPLTYISKSIARLSTTKALEILATSAMYHSDTLVAIGDALSQQEEIELQRGSVMFEHLLALSK